NHTAAFACSIGTPIRPNGIPDSKAFACSVDSWLQLSTAAVLVIPGQIELIRIFFLPNSKAALLVKPLTPCLAEIYGVKPGVPTKPPVDAVLTIAPPLDSSI